MNRFLSMLLTLAITFCTLPTISSFAANDLWDPFNGDKDVNVVYIGGSITDADGWRVSVGKYIKDTYEGVVPGRKINNYNAGIGGTASDYGLVRLERDVISKNPDLVFVEFAVNDSLNAIKKEMSINAMEGIVRRLQALPEPPMIVFIYTTGSNFINSYDVHSQVANYYDIPEINFLQHMLDLGFVGAPTGTTYDQLPPKLKGNWKDVTHPNSEGHKIWSDYAIKEIGKNPKKYFRHPKLNQNPMSADNFGAVSAKYITAKEALDSGMLSIKNKSKGIGIEGTDYILEGGSTLRVTGIGSKAVLNFEGKVIAMSVKVDATDSTIFTYEIDNGNITGKGNCFYGGEASLTAAGLNAGKHSLAVTVSEPRPTGSSGDNIRIKGFFIDNGSVVTYPVAYPTNSKINTWDGKVEADQNKTIEQNNQYKKDIDFVLALGIMNGYEDGTFKPDDAVTRAEFAQVMSTICRLGSDDSAELWHAKFYAQDNNNTIEKPVVAKQNRFSDVDSEYWATKIIESVTDVGIMKGVTEDKFEPDRSITVNEVVKTIVDTLGYRVKAELYGGYPNGYITAASQLGILKGLNLLGDQPIKRGELARLIYKSVDVEMLQTTKYSQDNEYKTYTDETLLTKVMKLKKITGVVTDNGVTSLTDKSAITKNHIKIDGEVLALSDKTAYIKGFVGRDVEAYYINEKDNDIHTVVYSTLSGKDSVVTFNVRDFISISGNKIEYKENEKTTSVNLKSAAYMIYNGLAVKSYDESNFNFDSGDVTLISTDGSGEYNTIIVNGYQSWYVGYVDTSNFKIYNKAADSNISTEDSSVEFNYKDNDTDVTILNNNLETASFNDIRQGSVLDVSENGKVVRVIITKAKIEGFKVEEMSNDGSEIVLKGGKKEYKVSRNYINAADKIDIDIGSTYNLYLNRLGYVAWLETGNSTDLVPAYLIQSAKSAVGLDTPVEMKLLSDKGQIIILKTADKVNVEGQDGSSNNYKASLAYDSIKNYHGLLRYKLDSMKKVNYIELPLSDVNAVRPNGRLGLLNDMSGMYYISPAQQFGAKIQINNDTKIFSIKSSATLVEEKKYKVVRMANLIDARGYTGKVFSTVSGSPYADFIVLADDDVNVLNTVLNKTLLVVTKIAQSVDDDGNTGKKVSGFQLSTDFVASNVEIFSKDSTIVNTSGGSSSAFDSATDGVLNSTRYTVEVGDIIRYGVENGNVDSAEIVFKANAVNTNGHKGKLAGTTGTFTAEALGKTNPYALNSDGTLRTDGKTFNQGEMRVAYGSVHSVYSNMLKYTTQDLRTGSYDINEGGGIYSIESIKFPTAVAVVTYSNDTVEARKGSLSDILAYKESGNDCSQIIVQTRSGRVEKMFIINGELK